MSTTCNVPADHVLHIRPAAGKERDVGSVVTVVPSLGPPPVKVPAVTGDLLQDARQAIVAAGLHVEAVRHRFDAEVPEGHVIAVRPDRARLPQGTSVTLIVSDGRKPVPVPDVSGMTEDGAVQALADFDVVIEEVFSAKVDRGRAIGTDPGTGTELQPGEPITLRISLGPEFFDSPNFVGMSVDAAQGPRGERGSEAHGAPGPRQQRRQHRQPAASGRHAGALRLHDHRVLRVILGAHVRRRHTGIEGAIEEAALRGADCIQIFISNPRAWAPPRLRRSADRAVP